MKYEIESKFDVLDEVECTFELERFSDIQREVYQLTDNALDDIFPFRRLNGTIHDIRFAKKCHAFIYLVEFSGGERLWVAEGDMKAKE